MSTLEYTALAVREIPAREYPKLRLLDRVRDAIRAHHYSRRTEKTYVAWIKRYIVFSGPWQSLSRGATTSVVTTLSAARQDIPRLVGEVRRLRRLLGEQAGGSS